MKNRIYSYWRSIASGDDRNFISRIIFLLLIPTSLLYSTVQKVRNWLYYSGVLEVKRLPKPTISIGNLTVGGTGKTPTTAWIARYLQKKMVRVAILSRGYGGSLEGSVAMVSDGKTIFLTPEECGDEPYLLASSLTGISVFIGSDRYAAGMMAMESCEPDVFLLDDGFQHIRLVRNINIVLLDCNNPFGNGWTLPAGLLRESISALKRGDIIIRTRCKAPCSTMHLISLPSLNARHVLKDTVPIHGGEPALLKTLAGKRCIAFAGIAEPESFFDALRCAGVELVETIRFADHVHYTDEDISHISESLQCSNAELALTTEKDGVKLSIFGDRVGSVRQVRLELELENPEILTSKLDSLKKQ